MHTPTVTTRDFISQLQPHADKRLVFEQDDRRIQPGYHVTEIKTASFRSLDCGARPQRWHETIVQLWDVADLAEEGHMAVMKFIAIWDKVNRDVGLDSDAEIKFEWGDAVTPVVHYTLGAMRVEGNALIVSLEPVRATCKPRDEWWLSKIPVGETARAQSANACCAPTITSASQLIRIAGAASDASAGCGGSDAHSRVAVCCN